jgi:hypothetical protein
MTTRFALAWYEILQMIGTFFRQPTVIEVAGSIEIEGKAQQWAQEAKNPSQSA